MAKATPPQEEVPEVLKAPEREDYRNDPNYGADNYFVPIDEGGPSATYYELKGNLAVPIHPDFISTKIKGYDKKTNQPIEIDYVNITDLKDLLDERVGVWTSEIISTVITAAELLIVVRISVHARDGIFSQDGNGCEWLGHIGFGDTYSNAYAQAFRRACEGHGLGRQLWRKTEVVENTVNETTMGDIPATREPASVNNMAQTMGDLVTTKQLQMIRTLANDLAVNADEECRHLMNCGVPELSKRAGSDFIDHLQNLQRNQGQKAQVAPRQTEYSGHSKATQEFMNDPAPAPAGPPASPKQLEYIKNLSQDKGQNEELMALDLFKVEFKDISKGQASKMIEELLKK